MSVDRHLHNFMACFFCKAAGAHDDDDDDKGKEKVKPPPAVDRPLAHSQACTLKGIVLWLHYVIMCVWVFRMHSR